MEKFDLLKTINFISPISDEKIRIFAEKCTIEKFDEGDIIFREDDYGKFFYIIKKGEVKVSKKLEIFKNKSFDLTTLSAKDYFGEMSLLDDHQRSATIIAKTYVELLKIEKEGFLDLSSNSPKSLLELSKTMSKRIRKNNENYMKIWEKFQKRKRLAAIGNTTSKLVHDLKTPMSVIVLNAQSISRKYPDTKSSVNKMIKQTKEMEAMVREILDFAKGDKINLKISKVNILSLVNDIIENFETLMTVYPVNVKLFNTLKNNDLILYIDKLRIKRVITNIVKNALEALNYKGKISIYLETVDEQCKISIIDSGKGLPEEIIDTIFDPFVTQGKSNGTGLGLAIVKKIVDDHHGKIVASNEKNAGAKFEIYLPIK